MLKKKGYYTLSELNGALPEATAEKFKLVKLDQLTSTVFVHAVHGKVNINELSIPKAQSLVDRGAGFIIAKSEKMEKPVKTEK